MHDDHEQRQVMADLEQQNPERYHTVIQGMNTGDNSRRTDAQRGQFIAYLKVMSQKKKASRIRGYDYMNEAECVAHWCWLDKTLTAAGAKKRFKLETEQGKGTDKVLEDEGELCLAIKVPMRVQMVETASAGIKSREQVLP